MQKSKQIQDKTLSYLHSSIAKLFNLPYDQTIIPSNDQLKQSNIQEQIKRLHPVFQSVLNASSQHEPKPGQAQPLQQARINFMKIIDILIQEVLDNDRTVCLEWMSSIIKINTNKEYKQQSVYDMAKPIDQTAVIALPSDTSAYQTSVALPDAVAQVDSSNSKAYFHQDQQKVTSYFDSQFVVVNRQGITPFATQVVQHISNNLVNPFLKQFVDLHSFESYLKFVEVVEAISAPIYTYFLITTFKTIIQKIGQFLITTKISTSINSQKINRLIYGLISISSRWEGSVYYSRSWQWQIKSKVILALISSNISQTKLTAVKMLSQFCRKSQYSSLKPQQLMKYIRDNKILQQIFSPDNHPQVISKGKQIYQFLCRLEIIEEHQIDILLNLLDKSHENVAKSIYITIQSLGEKNLQIYQHKILQRIEQLPRASFFIDQTLQLFETLMVIAPINQIKKNMTTIYNIIKKHYLKLRKNLREKLVRLYFQLFIMAVEEGVFMEDKTDVIIPIAQNLGTNLSALMLDTFIRVIKNQTGKKIYNECKQILKQSIEALFKKYKIHCKIQINEPQNLNNLKINRKNYKQILAHNPHFYSKEAHLGIIKFLLESYQKDELPLTYEQLCNLIQQDISFTKFIQYYNQKQQVQAINAMLSYPNKDSQHLANIVQVYSLINQQAKVEAYKKIEQWFLSTKQYEQKIKLGEFIVNNSSNLLKLQEVCKQIYKYDEDKLDSHQEMRLLSYLILLKYLVHKYDKKGFGKYLPFSYSSHSYDILINVTNSIDVLKPTFYDFQSHSYQTLSQVIFKILKHDNLKMSEVNFKVNQKYMSISDLQLKLAQIAKKIVPSQKQAEKKHKHYVSITVFDVFQNQWFDKSQLINQGILNYQIIIALSEIFTKFTTAGKMHRPETARLFEIATNTDKISISDSRVQHLFSHYSMNGQFLTLQQWLNFYQKSSEDNPGLVIDNLKKLGYSHLFKNQKQLLQEYNINEPNKLREYIVSQGQIIYNILLRNYGNNKINSFCKQLLQILPVQPKYIKQNQEKNKMEEKDKSSQAIQMNNQTIMETFLNMNQKTYNTRQLWYILALLEEFFTHDTEKGEDKTQKLQNLKQIIIKNSILPLNQQLKRILMKQQLDTQAYLQIQILIKLVSMIKEQLIRNYGVRVPKTLIQYKKSEQNMLQNADEIQDPLNINNQQQKNEITKELNIQQKNIIKLTFRVLNQNMNKIWQSSEKRKKILRMLDQLLVLVLIAMKQQKQQLIVETQLIFHNIQEIRSMYNNFYYLLCEIYPNIKAQYYSINVQKEKIKTINQSSNKTDSHCYDEFFSTLNKMLRLQTSQELNIYSKVSNNIQASIKEFISIHENKQSQKKANNTSMMQAESSSDESILFGRLMILDSIKVYKPNLQIPEPDHWLSKLLSQSHSNSTRAVLYRISHKLCSIDFNLNILRRMMEGVNINKNSQIRKHPRMGLFNLGCICYVNSTIQQLFMIKPFRKAIISTYLHQFDPSSYFYQFQYMIYQLSFGKRQFFIPDNFCLSYTDFENKPIDIKQQHDADQFLNSLFDRLQKTLNHADYLPPHVSQLIKNNFCGQMANIITCQSCFNNKIKIEDFYVLTLEIKNSKHLLQCFQKLTQPEIITDYYCENCDRKVQVIEKQLKIKRLPQFLFLHLQRLVFDLQSLSKIKLQHLVDYPQQLDLSQFFVSEDILSSDQEKAQYQLKGFIVHIGTSESGHYYSLVKEDNKWIKFDDSRVDQWKWDNNSREKQNTYILIYEKKQSKLNNGLQIKSLKKQQMQIGNPQIFEKVTRDNDTLIRQTIFLQKSFSRYLIDSLSRIQIPEEFLNSSPNQISIPYHPDHLSLPQKQKPLYQEVHNIILNYLRLSNQAKSCNMNQYDENLTSMKQITCYLIMLIHVYPELVKNSITQLLESHDGKINTHYLRIILTNNDKTIRQVYKLIFTKILCVLTSYIQQTFDNYFLPAIPNTYYFYIQKILQYLLGSLHDAAKNYSKMDQHFELMLLVMEMSEKACIWFEQQNLGPKLIHFLCGDETPMKSQLQSYNYSNPKKNQSTNTIAKIISIMVRICVKKNKHIQQNSLNYKAYYQTRWYLKVYDSRYDYIYVSQTLALLAQHNEKFSKQMCLFINERLNRFSHQDQYIFAYVDLLRSILSISDQLVKMRCQCILGVPKFFLDADDIITAQDTRYYKYWGNQFSHDDQIILPLLQILYINRLQINYFTLSATTAILRLIVKKQQIQKYILNLPGPIPFNYYTDWINILLKNGLKQDIILGNINKKNILNQIAYLLNIIEQKLVQQEQQHMKQQNIMQQYKQDRIIKIKQNNILKYYRLWGHIKQIVIMDPVHKQQYSCSCTLMEDQKQTKLIKYHIILNKGIKKVLLQFQQSNYQYTYQIKCNQVQITIPFDQIPQDITQNFKLSIIQRLQQQKHPQQQQQPQQIIMKQQNNDIQAQEQKSAGMNNNQQYNTNQSQQLFQCPFCTSISFSFTSRCPTCGEQWGQIM